MLILAIDLGKAKSVACWYQADNATHEFRTVPTRPGDVHTLLTDRPVDRVVIEICDAAGWIVDLCRTLGTPVQVARKRQLTRRPCSGSHRDCIASATSTSPTPKNYGHC